MYRWKARRIRERALSEAESLLKEASGSMAKLQNEGKGSSKWPINLAWEDVRKRKQNENLDNELKNMAEVVKRLKQRNGKAIARSEEDVIHDLCRR